MLHTMRLPMFSWTYMQHVLSKPACLAQLFSMVHLQPLAWQLRTWEAWKLSVLRVFAHNRCSMHDVKQDIGAWNAAS